MNVSPIDPDLLTDALQREGLDSVEGAFAFGGGEDLNKPNLSHRRRTHFEITDQAGTSHSLYLKRYGRESLRQRLRRRWTYGPRSSPAAAEYRNIRAARAAGVPTMQAVCFGEQFGLLGAVRSFVVVTAVGGDALERCIGSFLDRHGTGPETACLTEKLAELVRTFHGAGYVHRDLYASHVFLDESDGRMHLCLIDLARMFKPRWRRFRWRVKDLAQLKYSMPNRWVENFWEHFFDLYSDGMDAGLCSRYQRAIDAKAAGMRRRQEKKRDASAEGKGPCE